jgi:cell wall-associated NlpC family hydrolase
MRRKALALFSVLAVIALASAAAGARGSNPQIQRAKAQRRSVMARFNQIGKEADRVNQEWDGAKIQLAQVEQNLKRNEYALHVARRNLKAAQRRIMSRLRELYVNGQPSALDVLAGASSLSEVIDRLESAQVLSNQDAAIGKQAVSFQLGVRQRERTLQHERAKRVAVVNRLAAEERTYQGQLAQQKRLLASIGLTIHRLQVQQAAEARRQRELAAARVRAEIAQQRQQAREQAILQQQQAQSPGGGTSSSGGSSSSSGGAPSDPPPAAPPVAVATGGAGHPAAAQIALGYLGVPYVWGGSSPSGFDCSGLVMYVYEQLGISLAHYTGAQWSETEPISLSAAQPGDLIFFNGLSHVGIYLGNGQMVDAPHTGSVVRVESIYGFGSIDGARRVP